LAHQAEAIAVHATAGHSKDLVAGRHGAAIDQGVLLHHGHAEASQVVATGAIEAGHFGGFPAQQGAAALTAAVGDPFHHGGHRLGTELAGG
jgi:hypothetical protein